MASASVATFLALMLAASARGDMVGVTGDTGCQLNVADNATHGFYYGNLTGKVADAVTHSRLNNLNPTDIDTVREYTVDDATDVKVYDAYYDSGYCGMASYSASTLDGWIGVTTCDSLNSAGECEQHAVRFDLDFSETHSTTKMQELACHELGHTVGLLHFPPGSTEPTCMVQWFPKPNDDYSSTERGEINAQY